MCELCAPSEGNDVFIRSLGRSRRSVLGALGLGALGFGAAVTFGPSGAAAQEGPVTLAEGLTVRPRSHWAGESTSPAGLELEPEVRFLLVHHSASPNDYSPDDAPGIIAGFRSYHTSAAKGWPDVAYNFLIDRFGGIWEGRAGSLVSTVRGDATGGNQGFSQLVCLIGTFETEQPTVEAQESLVRTLAWLADRSGVDTSPGATASFTSLGSNRYPAGAEVTTTTINGHRSMSQTTCPGEALFPLIASDIIPRVEQRRVLLSAATTTTTAARPTTEAPSTLPPPASVAPTPTTAGETTTPSTDPVATEFAATRPDRKAGDDTAVLAGIAGLGLAAVGGLIAIRRRIVN